MELRLDGIKKTFANPSGAGDVVALDGLDLTIPAGQFLALLGTSGCGKSTLLEIIAGLQRPTSGRIFLDGAPVDEPHPRMSTVFQEDSTFPWRTVRDNVAFGLQMRGDERAAIARVTDDMIDLVGLRGFEDAYPHQLSGGMRQRVAIGRTLVTNPSVILMDEPFGALDEQTRFTLGEELLRIWAATRCTIVFVTHSLQEAIQLADRIVVLGKRPGRIVAEFENELPRPRHEIDDPQQYARLMTGLREAIGLGSPSRRLDTSALS